VVQQIRLRLRDSGLETALGLSVEETTRVLRRDMYAAQRKALVEARNAGELDDEVMRGELQHLDYEEAATAFDRVRPDLPGDPRPGTSPRRCG
jgi:hypothetical protein